MTEVFTKIKDNPIFKSDPDKVVRNFILPQYKRTMVEVLDDFIAVKFYSSPARDRTVKMHRLSLYARWQVNQGPRQCRRNNIRRG